MRVGDLLPVEILSYMGKAKYKPDPLSVVKLYIEMELSVPHTLHALQEQQDRWANGLQRRQVAPQPSAEEAARKLNHKRKVYNHQRITNEMLA